MRRRVSLITMLAAWLLATGSHWDLVQTFAWGRMIADYSRTMPLREAVRLTFTTDNLCGVCHAVDDAKQASQHAATSPGGKFDGKILLVFQAVPAFVVTAPSPAPWLHRDLQPLSAELAAPPSPPPRRLA